MLFSTSLARRGLLAAIAVAAGFIAAPGSASATTVELVSLRCIATEEGGTDQVRLKVGVDTKGSGLIFSRKMRKGDTWNLNIKRTFKTMLHVTLQEDDRFFDDDLGYLGIKFNAAPGQRTFAFKRSGAHYVLTYNVASTSSYVLRILSIKAVKTQEGSDDLSVRYKADGSGQLRLAERRIKTGQTWTLNLSVPFNTRAEVRLLDNDLIWDDNFGGVAVTPASVSSAPKTLRRAQNNAVYIITYQVVKK